MRRVVVWVGVVAVAAVLTVGGYLVFATFVLHGEVNAASLHSSVVGAAGAPDVGSGTVAGRCRPGRVPREWLCWVADGSEHGVVSYRVRIEQDTSCWDATGGGSGRPRRISGCVHLRD